MLLKFFLNLFISGLLWLMASSVISFTEAADYFFITSSIICGFDGAVTLMLFIFHDFMLERYYNRLPEPEISFLQYRRAFVRGALLFFVVIALLACINYLNIL